MKQITIDNKTYTLAYTFNSFKYIDDLDFSNANQFETKPIKMITMLSDLFYGALNHDKKNFIDRNTSDDLLEKYIETKPVADIFTELTNMLFESNFFKNLNTESEQKKRTKKPQ